MRMEATYKRGQVEWALWKYFTFLKDQTQTIPKVFRTRIKRLLELDRDLQSSRKCSTRDMSYAFINESPDGQGTDVSYTPFNTICLALGLELLDVGFKQSEIVLLLQHIRGQIEKPYSKILKNPPKVRSRILATVRPDSPAFEDKGNRFADCRVFVVINKVEIREVFVPFLNKPPKTGDPIWHQPVFCYGINELHEELHQMNDRKNMYRKALVVEMAHMVILVKEFLEKAEPIKRGRK